MANELKLEKIEDLLQIDQGKLKADEAKNVIKRVKQLLKVGNIKEEKADELAEDYKYEGVSVVGNQLVVVKFNLETKEARVVDIVVDSRDKKGRNIMATDGAKRRLDKLSREQKGE